MESIDLALGGEALRRFLRVLPHRRELGRVEMALVQGDGAFLDDRGDDARLRGAAADRADARMLRSDGVDLLGHHAGGLECVAAAVHGRRTGMRRLPVEGDEIALDPDGSEHYAEGIAEVLEDRSLLDVELEIGGAILLLELGLRRVLEFYPHRFERVDEEDAGLVLEIAHVLDVEVAREGARTEEASTEAGAFLVGPVHELDGDRGLALSLEVAQYLEASDHVPAAVEPAAVGDGVEVAADQKGLRALAFEGRPGIARGVLAMWDADRIELLVEKIEGLEPGIGERDALRARFVLREGPEFLQVGDRALGIQYSHGAPPVMIGNGRRVARPAAIDRSSLIFSGRPCGACRPRCRPWNSSPPPRRTSGW